MSTLSENANSFKSFITFECHVDSHNFDEAKNLKMRITKQVFDKIVAECDAMSDQANLSNQPYYPAWSDSRGQYYCKVLLSKAKKNLYEELVNCKEKLLISVVAMPFEFKNSNTGYVDGVSLYFHHNVQQATRKLKKEIPSDEQEPTLC